MPNPLLRSLLFWGWLVAALKVKCKVLGHSPAFERREHSPPIGGWGVPLTFSAFAAWCFCLVFGIRGKSRNAFLQRTNTSHTHGCVYLYIYVYMCMVFENHFTHFIEFTNDPGWPLISETMSDINWINIKSIPGQCKLPFPSGWPTSSLSSIM